MPVVGGNGRLVGIISEVDLLNHLLSTKHEHPVDETIDQLVNANVPTSDPEAPLTDVLPSLMERKVVVLVDESTRPVGILTVIDALEYVSPIEHHETPA